MGNLKKKKNIALNIPEFYIYGCDNLEKVQFLNLTYFQTILN